MTVALFRKGPCTVKLGGAVIGQTEGDVVFKYSPEWRMVLPDQSTGAQSSFLVSESVEAVVPLLPRADALELIKGNAMPGGLKLATPTDDDGASTVDGDHVAGVTTLNVDDGGEFADEKIIRIGSGTTREYRRISAIVSDALTVAALTFAHASGEAVAEVLGSYFSADEAVGQTALSVNDETDFADGAYVMIGQGSRMEVRKVSSTSTGVLNIDEPLAFAHSAQELIMVLDSDPKLKMTVGNNRSDVQFAELLIDPLDGSDDIKIYKALCTSEVEIALKKGEESVIELTYTGVEDTTRSNGDRLAAVGLQSVA